MIDHPWRSRGFGSMLLRGAEEYASKRGIKKMYLSTKGQEGFYLKNGYSVCPPIDLYSVCLPAVSATITTPCFATYSRKEYSGPPAPPMPAPPSVKPSLVTSSKTYMIKSL